MDSLVLISVVTTLADALTGARLVAFSQESRRRYRLRFERDGLGSTVAIALHPERSWIGRPVGRWPGPAWTPDPFAVDCARSLTGAGVEGVTRVGIDRIVRFRFVDGHELIAELGWHTGHLLLTGPGGTIVGSTAGSRGPGSARLAVGGPYTPPPLPAGKLPAHDTPAAAFDAMLEAGADADAPIGPFLLRRCVLGIGRAVSERVAAEAAAAGESLGTVLERRARRLLAGQEEPCIEGPPDPFALAEEGRLEPSSIELFPWEWGEPRPGSLRMRREDAAATAGLFYEALDRADLFGARVDGLRHLVRQTLRRVFDAEQRARADLDGFGDPDRFRRLGEALLAGLRQARRSGGSVVVPDPYEPSSEISIPADAGRPLTAVADDLFARHRRARRGREGAAARIESLGSRRGRLDRLASRFEGIRGFEELDAIEAEMRREGIAVGLERRTRATRPAVRVAPVRAEGVRMFTSRDGVSFLVGKGGRENDRLTFKLAAPDDFWLHAQGVPGAHVVVRNPEGRARPPDATLLEAAGAAAWFSDARGQGAVDVQWTRRKYVRRARGAPAGTVVLKRHETVRVRPSPPEGAGSGEERR